MENYIVMHKYSDSSCLFSHYLNILSPSSSKLEIEYRFHETRRWRFDYANIESKIAVEIDGGQWVSSGGRHNRDSDREKINEAISMGWKVLRFSKQQILNDPKKCIDLYLKTVEFYNFF